MKKYILAILCCLFSNVAMAQLPSIAEMEKDAKAGVCLAQSRMMAIYVDGKGVAKDFAKSKEYLDMYVDNPKCTGKLRMSTYYYFKKGDKKKAFEYILKDYEEGGNEDLTEYIIANEYLLGRMTERNIPEAIKWLKIGASNGDICSYSALGEIYLGLNIYVNDDFVKNDDKEAEKNFLKAINTPRVNSRYHGVCLEKAKYYLGLLYYDAQDYKKAYKYLDSMDEKTNVGRNIRLSNMYEKGLGVEKNADKAAELYVSPWVRIKRFVTTIYSTIKLKIMLNEYGSV